MECDSQSSHQEFLKISKLLKDCMYRSHLRQHFTLKQNVEAAAAAHTKNKQLQRKAFLVTTGRHLRNFASTE
jgi:hypothetical protein